MPYLTAAVVLVGIVAVVALLLTLALARRIAAVGPAPVRGVLPGNRPVAYRLPPGAKPSYFYATTTTGEQVSLDGLTGERALAGFFTPNCEPCHNQLPGFIDLAKSIPGGRSQVLVVISGRKDIAAEFAADLTKVAMVVIEESPVGGMGPVGHSFSVFGWPSFYLLDASGTVESSAPTISMLTAPVAS